MLTADDARQQAHRLLARGLSVIPVPRPQPGVPDGQPGDGKVPAIRWKDYQTRLPTDAELEAWFSATPLNLAVITGSVSGVVVIDTDDQKALGWCTQHLPYTPWQTNTARGYHLWYRYPDVRVGNRARIETHDGRLALDARGDGGYVIAPGSVHRSGVLYSEAGDWSVPRADVPVFWPGWLTRPRRTEPQPARLLPLTRAPQLRARAYLAAIPKPDIGCGSDAAVFEVACRLVRGFGLSAADAEDLLWDWAGGRPGWTRDWIAQKVAHADKYGTEPVGGLVS